MILDHFLDFGRLKIIIRLKIVIITLSVFWIFIVNFGHDKIWDVGIGWALQVEFLCEIIAYLHRWALVDDFSFEQKCQIVKESINLRIRLVNCHDDCAFFLMC